MPTYLVENRHKEAECDDAFDALENAAAESEGTVREDTLLCTCPHGSHGGTVIFESEESDAAEGFARHWDVGETTVHQISEMAIRGD